MKTINGYQLHDTDTQEILGTVYVCSENEDAESELFEGWGDFNKLEEHDGDRHDVDYFIEWFNENYLTKIAPINLNFIQP